MKATDFQKLLLEDMVETSPWDDSCCNGTEKRSLANMMEKGFVTQFNYANGMHWELTDKGREEVGL